MRHLFIDDMTPAINRNSYEWKHLEIIMDKNPDIIATLFIIADNQETKMRHGIPTNYKLSLHPQWCKWIDSLRSNPRYRIGYHGNKHWNNDLHNAEEYNTNDKGYIDKSITKMLKTFNNSLLPIDERIFKIPGHKCNPYLFECLKKRNFDYVSFHQGTNQTNVLPTIITDGKEIINSHMDVDSPTYIGRIGLI